MLFTFALMGVSIAGLALTPSYASIGIAAPALVLFFRLAQGFALGGEVGPTTAFLLEAAPRQARGFYVSLQNATQYLSVLCVGLVGTLLSGMLAPDVFGAWGWRAAMLVGAAMVPFAWMLRRRLPETLERAAQGEALPMPLLKVAALGVVTIAATSISTYLMNYIGTYAQHTLRVSQQLAFLCTVMGGLAAMLGALSGGTLSDRFGRKPVMLVGGVMTLLLGVPCFTAMLVLDSPAALLAATALVAYFIGFFPPVVLTNLCENFPAGRRAGALGITYALAVAVFGGSAQYAAAWATDVTGSPLAPAWYMTGAMIFGVAAMAMMKETAPVKIHDPHLSSRARRSTQ